MTTATSFKPIMLFLSLLLVLVNLKLVFPRIVKPANTLFLPSLSVSVNRSLLLSRSKLSEAHYKEIAKEVSSFIKEIGFNPKSVPFVPISGWHGDSMLEDINNTPWFKRWNKETKAFAKTSKTLLEVIDAIDPPTLSF
jgi:elongation factor 1-alpha